MILTPKEASQKICPLMTMQFNQPSGNPVRQGCLADACMKWRWSNNKSPEEVAKWDPLQTGAVGYCGA